MNNYVIFSSSHKNKWWTKIKECKAETYSDVIKYIFAHDKLKKIRFKISKGSGKNKRFESISFYIGKTKYQIVNWGKETPTYG